MSLYDYQISREIAKHDHPFYAIIMAAYRQADTQNQRELEAAFPKTVAELKARYNAPGGIIDSDRLSLRESLGLDTAPPVD